MNKRHKRFSQDLAQDFAVAVSLFLFAGNAHWALARAEDAPATISAGERSAQPAPLEYYINSDDVLDIRIFDVPEVSRDYRVSSAGLIQLPLLHEAIEAAGLTPNQLSRLIATKYSAAGILSDPQVSVTIKESRTHSIAITGAVKKPQIYQLFGRSTLLDVLSQAEGLAEDAGDTAVITRGDVAMRVLSGPTTGGDGGQTQPVPSRTVTIDLKRLLNGGDPTLNPDLFPGDRVTIPRAGVIYVVGAVNRAGGFTLKEGREEMTVLKALALAEDLKPTAIRNKSMIVRGNQEHGQTRQEIPVNLDKVLAGTTPDPRLESNDILFVPDSTAKRALRRSAEAAVQIATGVIIWRR